MNEEELMEIEREVGTFAAVMFGSTAIVGILERLVREVRRLQALVASGENRKKDYTANR